jgi:membrane-associated phospholipid phosphatase
MKKFLPKNGFYFLLALFALLGFGFLFLPKGTIFLELNALHSKTLDGIFKTTNAFAETACIVLVTVLLILFKKYGKALFIALSVIVAGMVAQFFKRMMFADMPRPSKFYEGIQELIMVPGVEVHGSYSFPSGHTASAFALFASIALLNKYKWAQYVLFVLALSTGVARMYLNQHFYMDVYAGAMIGSFTALGLYIVFNKFKWV